MAEETKAPAAPATPVTEVVAACEPTAAPAVEQTKECSPVAVEKEIPTEEVVAACETDETEKPKEGEGEAKIEQSEYFKEDRTIVADLEDPEKKALDELKQIIQDALNKHGF